MKYCIRCNPRSELVTDENGELVCRFHGEHYILEEAPDEQPEPEEPQQ
jgi:hypothetical protein